MQNKVTWMSKLDEIFFKRLKKIQKELNTYIDSRYIGTDVKLSVPMAGCASQQRTNNLSPKFLNCMRLSEAGEEEEHSEEEHSEEEFSRRSEKYLDLHEVLEKKEESFSEMLLHKIDEKGLKDSDVYKQANIDRRLFSKIRGDKDYVPSKKTAISFCLALQLELDETKKLLAAAGYTLSVSSRFDLVIMYLIEKCEYNVHFANIVLDEYGEGTLSR